MNGLFMMNVLAGSATDAPPANSMTMLWGILPYAAVFAAMYFLLLRPQKKRERADLEMRSNLQVADEIITTGGIIGRVVSMKDDTLVIETSGDRTKIRILKTAIAKNNTVHDNPPA